MKELLCFSIKRITLVYFLLFSSNILANNISLEQVTKDINYLADDKLKGRKVYSPGINLAADYIAKRFIKIGLKPLKGMKNFKQSFSLFQIKQKTNKITLEQQAIAKQNVIVLTAHEQLLWNEKSNINIQFISNDDDFRSQIRKINQQGSNSLVIVAKKHAEAFSQYHSYFMRGVTKFAKNTGPSAVIILSNKKNISKFNIKAISKISLHQLTNIVGVLPGKSKKNESVLFSAHYDHIGFNPQLNKDKIFNGADDNASGTTAVLNLASYFAKKNNNQRSLVFVAFTGEEIGGWGSKYFSQKIDPDTIVAMLNFEMIGKPSKFGKGQLWMTGYQRSNLAQILNNNLSKNQIHSDPYPQQKLFYRSDNATLARLGVPAHSFSSSQIDKDKHYHQTTDEVSTLNLQSMTRIIQTIAEASKSLVDGTDTPTRLDTTQVTKAGKIY